MIECRALAVSSPSKANCYDAIFFDPSKSGGLTVCKHFHSTRFSLCLPDMHLQLLAGMGHQPDEPFKVASGPALLHASSGATVGPGVVYSLPSSHLGSRYHIAHGGIAG